MTTSKTNTIPPELQNYLFSYCKALHRFNGIDHAEDLYQDVMLQFYRNIDHYQEQGNLKAYLTTIAKNRFIDWLDSRRRRRDLTVNGYMPNTTARNDGEHLLGLEEINHQIAQLEPIYRTAFELFAVERLKYEEIAEQLDTPIGTIKSRIFLARKQLQYTLTALDNGQCVSKQLIRELKAHKSPQRIAQQ